MVSKAMIPYGIPPVKNTIEGYGFEPELFHYGTVDRSQVLQRAFGQAWKNGKRLAVIYERLAQEGLPTSW